MTTGHVFIATSLDGFIARPDGAIDWLDGGDKAPEGEDFGYAAFMEKVDGLVMGRASFETVTGFDRWPYAKPVVVLSDTLAPSDLPQIPGAELRLMAGAPAEVMARLTRMGWRRAYVDGGATIRRFLAAGCIDEVIVTRLPVLIGEGRPLFGGLDRDLWLHHAETRSWPNGMVQSRYLVPRTRS